MVAIAQIVESFAYGTAKSVIQLCDLLPESDQVSVYYGRRQGTEVDLQALSDRVQWHPLPGSGPTKHATNLRYLYRELGKQYDIVHGHSSFGGLYAKLIGPMHGLQTLYSPRGYSFLREDFSRAGRALFRTIEKVTSRRCVTVCCGPYEEQLAKELGGPTVRINNGYKVSPPQPVAELSRSVLGVGRICPQKGFDIFSQVASSLPSVSFTWVGDTQKGDAESVANLPPNLNVVSYLPHHELLQMIQQCRCVFLPSRWEGLSRFLIESVCLGKAIVTSRFPGNLDCLDGDRKQIQFANGMACHDLPQYIDAVSRLATDDQLLESMQYASFRYASENFDLDKIMMQWKALYRSLSAASPACAPAIDCH